MWRSWQWMIFFMIICTQINSQYLRGSLGKYNQQKILMLHDHSVCLSNIQHVSLRHTLMYSFSCVKFKISHCLMKKHEAYSSLAKNDILPLQNISYCGSIWLLEKPQTSYREHIFIGVMIRHNIHLNILRFNFFLAYPILCHQHSMSFSYTTAQFETYCGIRMPWDIIVKENKMYIHLSIREFKMYSFHLYYSSFRSRWIANVTRVFTEYSDISSFYVIKPYAIFDIFVKSYTYYVMSHQENYLMFKVLVTNLIRAHMIIYDGPGELSRNIFEINDEKLKGYSYIRTTAFLAFIKIRLLDNLSRNFKHINISTTYNKHDMGPCVNLQTGIIQAKSNMWKNIACTGTFRTDFKEVKVKFRTFTFSGPNMLTDSSDSVCQYGGLVVQFNRRKEQHEFCESLHDYILHSKNKSLTFIVVWFSGYSHGVFRANLLMSDCKTYYAEFYLSKSTLLLPNILHQPTLSQGCDVVICPALQYYHQRRFTLQFGPDSLGTISLSVIQYYTLSACDTEVRYDYGSEINIKSIALENWPLHLRPNISDTYHNITDNVMVTFAYLYTANVSLRYICNPEMTRKQMAVVVKQSSCQERQTAKPFVVNKIPSLRGACLNGTFYLTPSSKGSEGYIDFIYKDTGQINEGIDLLVGYSKCPSECRTYRYSIFVKMVDDKTVRQYTTNVGQSTFTGKYHRGFRLTILLPHSLCDQHLTCQLQLSPGRFKSDGQNVKHQPSTWHFYEKR